MARPRRNQAQRHPGGQVVRHCEDPRTVALAVRARQNALDRAADPMLGTPVGRMFLLREIGPTQYDAAAKLATLRAAADRARGLQPRTPKALDMGSVRRGGFGASHDHERDAEIIAAADAAEAAVTSLRSLAALYDCVILEHEPAGHEQRMALKDGLSELARHWRLRAL